MIKWKDRSNFNIFALSHQRYSLPKQLNLIRGLSANNDQRTCNYTNLISIVNYYLWTWIIRRFCTNILNLYRTSRRSIRNSQEKSAVDRKTITTDYIIVRLRNLNLFSCRSEKGKLKTCLWCHPNNRPRSKFKSFMNWDRDVISKMLITRLDTSSSNFKIARS